MVYSQINVMERPRDKQFPVIIHVIAVINTCFLTTILLTLSRKIQLDIFSKKTEGINSEDFVIVIKH